MDDRTRRSVEQFRRPAFNAALLAAAMRWLMLALTLPPLPGWSLGRSVAGGAKR